MWHTRPPYEHLQPDTQQQEAYTAKSTAFRELSRAKSMTHDVACYMQVRAKCGTFRATMYSEALVLPGMYGFCKEDPKSHFYRLIMENHPCNPMWYSIGAGSIPADAVDDEFEVLQVGTEFKPNVLLGFGSMDKEPEPGLYRMGPLVGREKVDKPNLPECFWVTVVIESTDSTEDTASASVDQ